MEQVHTGCPSRVYERAQCSSGAGSNTSQRMLRDEWCSNKPYMVDVRCTERHHGGTNNCVCDPEYPDLSLECHSPRADCKCSAMTYKHSVGDSRPMCHDSRSRSCGYGKPSYDTVGTSCLTYRDQSTGRTIEIIPEHDFRTRGSSSSLSCQRDYHPSDRMLDISTSSPHPHQKYMRTGSPLHSSVQYRPHTHAMTDEYSLQYPTNDVVYIDNETESMKDHRAKLVLPGKDVDYEFYRPAPYHIERHPPATVREVETRYVLGDMKPEKDFKEKYVYPKKREAPSPSHRVPLSAIKKPRSESKPKEDFNPKKESYTLSKQEIEFIRNLVKNTPGNQLNGEERSSIVNLPVLTYSSMPHVTEPKSKEEPQQIFELSRQSPQNSVTDVFVNHQNNDNYQRSMATTSQPVLPGSTNVPGLSVPNQTTMNATGLSLAGIIKSCQLNIGNNVSKFSVSGVAQDSSPSSCITSVPFSPSDGTELNTVVPSINPLEPNNEIGNDDFFDSLKSIDDLFGIITN